MSSQSALLLRRQLTELNKHPVEGFSAGLIDDNDIYRWEVLIIGPPDTYFAERPNEFVKASLNKHLLRYLLNYKIEGGFFKAHLTFSKEYPQKPPKMKFITEIWHPNISKTGDVCISILHDPGEDKYGYERPEERWLPIHTVETIMVSVISMLADPNDESPANLDAAHVGSWVSKKLLPNGSSIFSAEARGLLMALDMVHQSSDRQLLFLSDSLSCLQSLKNRDLSHPLIADILCRVHVLLSRGAQVAFMWVPSHVRLAGNSAADIAAKASLLLPISNLPVPPSDFCSLIRSHSLKQWQESWNSESLNKLHAIGPKVNVFNLYRLPRRDEIIIHRLRIGHSFLTHGHLLHGKTCPWCSA